LAGVPRPLFASITEQKQRSAGTEEPRPAAPPRGHAGLTGHACPPPTSQRATRREGLSRPGRPLPRRIAAVCLKGSLRISQAESERALESEFFYLPSSPPGREKVTGEAQHSRILTDEERLKDRLRRRLRLCLRRLLLQLR